MARTSGRSYYTYRQLVLRAIIELEQDNTRRGHSFHTKTIRSKVRNFACTGDVHLGEYWDRHVTRAAAALLEEDVLRKTKQRGYLGLSPKGRKRLVGSNQRYGSLDKLSPFKKSQFLKAVAIISARGRSTFPLDNEHSQKCRMQEKLIAALRASISQAETRTRCMSTELEEARRERDDLELSLRDLESSSTLPFESHSMGNTGVTPGLTLRFGPMTSTLNQSPHQPTAPSDRDSSPDPLPMDPTSPIATPIAMRPITTFAHRPSGSFLNTVSNQFTPSPTPSPVPAADNTTYVSNLDLLNDEPGSDDANDFDMPDFDDADMDLRLECGAGGEKHMEVDSEAMQQKEVEPRSMTRDLAAAGKNITAFTDTVQQLAATLQERDAMNTQVVSMTQERDILRQGKAGLEAALRDRDQEIGGLQNTLAVAVQDRDALQAAQASVQGQWVALDHARIAAESESARVSAELGHRTGEVTALNTRVDELTIQLQQSNARRDDALDNLDTTTFQLEAAESLLQNTRAQLVATDAQLRGVQNDLRMVWKELQASNSLHIATQVQLDAAQMQFESTRAELDMANVRVDSTASQLHATAAQLQTSNAQLNATNAQLTGTKADLQMMWGELQISDTQRVTAEAHLESTNAKLDATNLLLNHTRGDLQQASYDLETSNAEIEAINAQLNGAKADVQRLGFDLEQAHDREHGLSNQLRDTTLELNATHLELKQMANKAVDRERYLESQLEDAQERVALAQEDLARVQTAWIRMEQKRKVVVDAEEEVRQMLFSGPCPKRDASFRDSGVNIMV